MVAFYNEIDRYAAQWLRNLIEEGHIAPGIVDERDIRDIEPRELEQFEQCHFFAGIGVWSYALRRAGWPDDRPIWTGSCPCQPFSAAGKRAGFADERHLWPSWHWLIKQCQPSVVVGEQVADALAWLDVVSADMEAQNYTWGAGIIPSAAYGSAHRRQRSYFAAMADPFEARWRQSEYQWPPTECDKSDKGQEFGSGCHEDFTEWVHLSDGSKRPIEPGTCPLANGAANFVGRLRAYGNAIDARTATAWCSVVKEICDGQYEDQAIGDDQSSPGRNTWAPQL